MTLLLSRLAAAFLLAIMCIVGADNADAGPLDDAKAQGLVGERLDGYLGIVSGNGDAQALVDKVNAGRKAKYAEVAAKRGAPVEAVAQIAGKKLIERAPSGQFVLDSSGNWRKK